MTIFAYALVIRIGRIELSLRGSRREELRFETTTLPEIKSKVAPLEEIEDNDEAKRGVPGQGQTLQSDPPPAYLNLIVTSTASSFNGGSSGSVVLMCRPNSIMECAH